MEDTASTWQKERVLAALMHGSILCVPIGFALRVVIGTWLFADRVVVLGYAVIVIGIATALAIWLVQRRRSAYVASHAQQAFIFQIAAVIVFVVGGFGWLLLFAVVLGIDLGDPPAGSVIGLACIGLQRCELRGVEQSRVNLP
jgi:hypothetical protein